MKLLRNVICIMLVNGFAVSLHAAEPRKVICPVRPIAAKKACEASLAQQAAHEAKRRHTIAVTPVKKAGAGIGMIPPLAPMSSFPTVESLLILKDQKQNLLTQATAEQKKVLHNQIAQIDAELKNRQPAVIAGRPALKRVIKQAEVPLMPLPPLRAIPFKAGLIKLKLELAVKRGELKSEAQKKQIDAQIAQIDAELKRRRGVSKITAAPKPKLAIKVTEAAQIKLLENEFTALSGTMMDELKSAGLLMIVHLAAKYSDEEKVRVMTEIILDNNQSYVEAKMNEFMVAIGLPPEKIEPKVKV